MGKVKDLLVAEVRRRLMEEGVPRIEKCLAELSLDEVWYRPNENSNSMGNLVLHLCGNVRQWLVSGLGGAKDTRQRSAEFSEKGPVPKDVLLENLQQVMAEVDKVLDQVKGEDLTKTFEIQGFKESGLSILVHVVEHFSYHVGQMTYFVKWRKDIDTAYYGGLDLDVRSK